MSAKETVKEPSMLKQKEMIARNYDAITSAKETGRKVSSTFVPGNLNELVMSFGILNNLRRSTPSRTGCARPRAR